MNWFLDTAPDPVDWNPEFRWRGLFPETRALATWLLSLGLNPGSRVAVDLPTGPLLPALYQAAPLAGVSLLLLPCRASAADRQHLLRLADPACTLDQLPEHLPEPGPLRPLRPQQEALIVATSGSSGAVKGVRLSLANLLHAATAQSRALDLHAGERWLACMPLDHVGGALLAWRAAVSGSHLLLQEGFDLDACWRGLQQCHGASLVPTMLHRLLRRFDAPWPPNLRRLLLGGGPADAADLDAAEARGLRPILSYGCTESAAMACMQDVMSPGRRVRPLPGMELRVAEERVLLRGAQLFIGYLNDRDRDPQEWFDTGDIGDLDQNGLRIHMRRSDRIVSGGENVNPIAVETVLRQHPCIEQAAVCGLPDAEWGQIVAAALVGRVAISETALRDWCRQRLPGYAVPKRWLQLTELPTTRSGKLDRRALADHFSPPAEP